MLAVILRLMKKLGLNISSMPLSCNVGSGLNLGLSPPSWPATFMVIGAEKDVLKELPLMCCPTPALLSSLFTYER